MLKFCLRVLHLYAGFRSELKKMEDGYTSTDIRSVCIGRMLELDAN